MASLVSTVSHQRPFTLSTIIFCSSSPSLPSSISFTTPKSRSKALRKATLIYATKEGLPAQSNTLQFLRKTTVLLTASAALLGCLSKSPCFAETHIPFASAVETSVKPKTIEDVQNSAMKGVKKGKLGEVGPVVERLMELDPTSKGWALMRRVRKGNDLELTAMELASRNHEMKRKYKRGQGDFDRLLDQFFIYQFGCYRSEFDEHMTNIILEGTIVAKTSDETEGRKTLETLLRKRRIDMRTVWSGLPTSPFTPLVNEDAPEFFIEPRTFAINWDGIGIMYQTIAMSFACPHENFQEFRRSVPKGHPYEKLFVFDANIISDNFFPKEEDHSFDEWL